MDKIIITLTIAIITVAVFTTTINTMAQLLQLHPSPSTLSTIESSNISIIVQVPPLTEWTGAVDSGSGSGSISGFGTEIFAVNCSTIGTYSLVFQVQSYHPSIPMFDRNMTVVVADLKKPVTSLGAINSQSTSAPNGMVTLYGRC